MANSTNAGRPELSHLGPDGEARMVDVSNKPMTAREATASGTLQARAEVLNALLASALPKGDALATARVAGVLAAKRTAELIPMCHPLALDWVRIEFSRPLPEQLSISCTAKTAGRTGVEMEALTGVAVAALTLYDMAKAADKSMVIGPIQLERKSSGKSGTYQRSGPRP